MQIANPSKQGKHDETASKEKQGKQSSSEHDGNELN